MPRPCFKTSQCLTAKQLWQPQAAIIVLERIQRLLEQYLRPKTKGPQLKCVDAILDFWRMSNTGQLYNELTQARWPIKNKEIPQNSLLMFLG